MFTGLVETKSQLLSRTTLSSASGEKMTFAHDFEAVSLGESIAVNGACLTVISFDAKSFSVELSPETLHLTTLGDLKHKDPVNLERAVKAGSRLGGHLVTGHVDGVATVKDLTRSGDMTTVSLELPSALTQYVAKKGSLTVDGVSLTINDVTSTTAQLLLIPHTQEVTTLGRLQTRSRVNVEVDLVARYVERLLLVRNPSPGA